MPIVSLGAGGIGLLRTRSRLTGILLVIASIGARCSPARARRRSDDAGVVRRTGCAAAARRVRRAGVPAPEPAPLGRVLPLGDGRGRRVDRDGRSPRPPPPDAATLGPIVALALIGHGWWVLETGDDRDQDAVLWLGLACLVAALDRRDPVRPVRRRRAPRHQRSSPRRSSGRPWSIGVRRPGFDRHPVTRRLRRRVRRRGPLLHVGLHRDHGRPRGVRCRGSDGAVLRRRSGWCSPSGTTPSRSCSGASSTNCCSVDRPDPLLAATAVADRIGDEPLVALRAIREALVLPYAGISLDGVELATSGTAVTETRRMPLLRGDDTRG